MRRPVNSKTTPWCSPEWKSVSPSPVLPDFYKRVHPGFRKERSICDGCERLWGSFFPLQCPSRRQSQALETSLPGWAREHLSPGGPDAWREEAPRSRRTKHADGGSGEGERGQLRPGSVTANPADIAAGHSDARSEDSSGGEKRLLAPQRGRAEQDGGAACERTRVSARPVGRAGTRSSHALGLGLGLGLGARSSFRFRPAPSRWSRCMCGNNRSAPLPAIVPAARKASAAVSGGGRSSEGPAQLPASHCPSRGVDFAGGLATGGWGHSALTKRGGVAGTSRAPAVWGELWVHGPGGRVSSPPPTPFPSPSQSPLHCGAGAARGTPGFPAAWPQLGVTGVSEEAL